MFVAVRSVHWFNPVAYLLASGSKRFAEESADERAIGADGAQERESYGRAMPAYAVETVTFLREGDAWKAAGYYIKPG